MWDNYISTLLQLYNNLLDNYYEVATSTSELNLRGVMLS